MTSQRSTERIWTTRSVGIGIGIAIITAVLWKSASVRALPSSFPSSTKEFFGAIAGLAGVIAGFVITAKAVLLGVPTSGRTGRTVRIGNLQDVVSMMRVAALSAVVVGLASCVLILFSGAPNDWPFLLTLSVWLGAFTTSSATFLLFMRGFGKLATNMMEDRRSEAVAQHSSDSVQMIASIAPISDQKIDVPRNPTPPNAPP